MLVDGVEYFGVGTFKDVYHQLVDATAEFRGMLEVEESYKL